jgi:hypothetical protein
METISNSEFVPYYFRLSSEIVLCLPYKRQWKGVKSLQIRTNILHFIYSQHIYFWENVEM